MYDLEYCQRLERLGLPSLEYRRLRGDLIETYKVLHEIYDPITTRDIFSLNKSGTRGHNFKLAKNSLHLNIKKLATSSHRRYPISSKRIAQDEEEEIIHSPLRFQCRSVVKKQHANLRRFAPQFE